MAFYGDAGQASLNAYSYRRSSGGPAGPGGTLQGVLIVPCTNERVCRLVYILLPPQQAVRTIGPHSCMCSTRRHVF